VEKREGKTAALRPSETDQEGIGGGGKKKGEIKSVEGIRDQKSTEWREYNGGLGLS